MDYLLFIVLLINGFPFKLSTHFKILFNLIRGNDLVILKRKGTTKSIITIKYSEQQGQLALIKVIVTRIRTKNNKTEQQ